MHLRIWHTRHRNLRRACSVLVAGLVLGTSLVPPPAFGSLPNKEIATRQTSTFPDSPERPRPLDPATLTIPFEMSAIPTGANPGDILVVSQSDSGFLQIERGTSDAETSVLDINTAQEIVSVAISHFTTYAPEVVDPGDVARRVKLVANIGCSSDPRLLGRIIDDQVVMPGFGRIDASRSNADIAGAHAQPHLAAGDDLAVFGPNEISLSIGGDGCLCLGGADGERKPRGNGYGGNDAMHGSSPDD